jgi:flagellar biosynthesis/type III secretory pathway chaperone
MRKFNPAVTLGKVIPPTAVGDSGDFLVDQLHRLSLLLDQETDLIAAAQLTELPTIIQRKNIMLLQLDGHDVSAQPVSPRLQREISSVRDKLARNRLMLQLNIRAMQELNNLLAERHRDVDSDGTYTVQKR